jgi:hypothetical protein
MQKMLEGSGRALEIISLKSLLQFLTADRCLRLFARRQANVVTMKYRGIEFYIHQIAENRWNWRVPTRMEISIPITGVVGGNKEATIAKCRSLINEQLDRNHVMRHGDWLGVRLSKRS